MAGYSSNKDKLAYFKDNRQGSDSQQEEFDINKYYYNREGAATTDQMQPHMHGENRGYNGYMQQGGPNYSMHGQQSQQQQHLMNQQRPGMPPMVGRSQSGGGPPEWRPPTNMPPKSGEYMGNPPPMQRAATAPYNMGSNPQMSMGGGMGNMYPGRDVHGQQIGSGYGGSPSMSPHHHPGRAVSETSLPYDASNFPALQSSAKGWNPGGMSQAGGMSVREEEFTIQNEDFPALPGSATKMGANAAVGSSGRPQQSESSGSQSQSGVMQSPARSGKPSPVLGGQNPPSSPSQRPSAGSMSMGIGFGGGMIGQTPPSPGMQPQPTPSSGSVPPVSMETKYGLMGLLDVVKMTDRDLNTLALGSDLTTFGLNLNSTDPLYSTFTSPFVDQPVSTEPQYTTPACYHMHPPNLKPEHLSKFQVDSLFYMFYAMPRDVLQTSASLELHRRDWRYHAELRVWLKARSPQELMQGQPNVQYVFFDASAWEARLFTGNARAPLANGFLTEEDLRVKVAQAPPSQMAPGQGGQQPGAPPPGASANPNPSGQRPT